MTGRRETIAAIATRPYLATYLAAVIATWLLSALTWRVQPGRPIELASLAQALQYLLVLLAGALAALHVRSRAGGYDSPATVRFYDYELALPDDSGGATFWRGIAAGIVAMLANVAFVVAADLVAAAGAAGGGSYIGWIGAGIAAGGVLGMFGALFAYLIAGAAGRARRRRTR